MINTTTCKARQAANAGNALFWRRSISANNSSTNYSYIICWRNLGKWQPAAWGSCEEPLGVACSEEEGCGAEPSASSRCLCCSAFLSLSRCRPLRIIANSGPINSDKQGGETDKRGKREALSNQYIEQRGGVRDWPKRQATGTKCPYSGKKKLLTARNHKIEILKLVFSS